MERVEIADKTIFTNRHIMYVYDIYTNQREWRSSADKSQQAYREMTLNTMTQLRR